MIRDATGARCLALDHRVDELFRAGQDHRSNPFGRAVLGVAREGAAGPAIARSLNNLAAFYLAQGRLSEAEPLLKRALGIREKALPADHDDIILSLNELAGLYYHKRAQAR